MANDRLKLFTRAPEPLDLGNGNIIYIKRVSAAVYAEWLDRLGKYDQAESIYKASLNDASWIAKQGVVNSDGSQFFAESDDIAEIDHTVLDLVVKAILKLNGFGGNTEDDAKKKSVGTEPITNS